MINLNDASEVLSSEVCALRAQCMVDVVVIVVIVIDDSVDDRLRAVRRKEISQISSIFSV